MATVTFQTIVCDSFSGLLRLSFTPSTESNPFWQRRGKNITPNVPTSLGNITRNFSATGTVTLSIINSSGTSNSADDSISESGALSLKFTIGTSNFTVNCFVS